ncbi:hypothetical protein [Brockia lithotrophica]|uniref:Uncharacterized protein n=1 Tax=Brockia lithotrophica TaxID=933949 RepID=A0A660L6F3_9BACL|nr:hypothetical protein [Brockia lithotrophica]RKQ88402.1 hypothetical protein C7438_0035 [Brockia lithotrophica]
MSETKAERNLIAYFRTAEDADRVKEALWQLGIDDVRVEPLYAQPYDDAARPDPMSGRMPSLAGSVLDVDVPSRGTAVLLGADPAVSGMADGEGRVEGWSVVLAAVVPEIHLAHAQELVRRHGGRL